MTHAVSPRTDSATPVSEPDPVSSMSANAVAHLANPRLARLGGTRRCLGTLVVFDDGSPAFCTTGCALKGTADALVRHQRFVPGTTVVPAFLCLLFDGPPSQLLVGRAQR